MPARRRLQVSTGALTPVPQIANLETRRVVGDPAVVAGQPEALWDERRCGVGAYRAARRRLPIASRVPREQAPWRCRWPD
jgi:hypothetical protein